MKMNLKKALNKLGYNIIQYNKGYNSRSGFMMKDNQLYYFSYEDLRWNPTLLIRTADPTIKNKKGEYADYRGGRNTFPNLQMLGIEINEPRSKKDFNAS